MTLHLIPGRNPQPGAAATLAFAGTPTPMNSLWHDHLRAPVEAAIAEWEAS